MSGIAGRTPTGYVCPAGFTTKQHPESCYLHTRLMPCCSNLWGFLWPSYKSSFHKQNSSQGISNTVNDPFLGFYFSGKTCWFAQMSFSSGHLPSLSHATCLKPDSDHSGNTFPALENDINCAGLMLMLAPQLMNAVNLPTMKGALKHRRSTGCLRHGDSQSQRRLANPWDLNTFWTVPLVGVCCTHMQIAVTHTHTCMHIYCSSLCLNRMNEHGHDFIIQDRYLQMLTSLYVRFTQMTHTDRHTLSHEYTSQHTHFLFSYMLPSDVLNLKPSDMEHSMFVCLSVQQHVPSPRCKAAD